MKEKLKLFLTRRNVTIISVVTLAVLLLIVIIAYTLSLQTNKVETQTPVSNGVSMPVSATINSTTNLTTQNTESTATSGSDSNSPASYVDNITVGNLTESNTITLPYSPKDNSFTDNTNLIDIQTRNTIVGASYGQNLEILNCTVEEAYQATEAGNWSNKLFTPFSSLYPYIITKPSSWKVSDTQNAGFTDLAMDGCYSNFPIAIRVSAILNTYSEPDSTATLTPSGNYMFKFERNTSKQIVYSGSNAAKLTLYPDIASLNLTIYDTVNKQSISGEVHPINIYSLPDQNYIYSNLEGFINLWISKM